MKINSTIPSTKSLPFYLGLKYVKYMSSLLFNYEVNSILQCYVCHLSEQIALFQLLKILFYIDVALTLFIDSYYIEYW